MARTPNMEKWGRSTARKRYADGGQIEEQFSQQIADPKTPPTDEAITEQEVKTWGSPGNARAAANARKYAKPPGEDAWRTHREYMSKIPVIKKRGGKV